MVEIVSEGTRSKALIKKLDLYMSCNVREYWIVNPLNREVAVYLFADKNIADNITYKKSEIAQFYIFYLLNPLKGKRSPDCIHSLWFFGVTRHKLFHPDQSFGDLLHGSSVRTAYITFPALAEGVSGNHGHLLFS